MTVTINQTADTLTFSQSDLNTSLATLGLTTKFNCASTSNVLNLASKIAGITNNSFTLTATEFYGTTTAKFKDGIYNFVLVYTHPLNGATIVNTEKYCFVVDYDLKCLYLTKQVEEYDNSIAKQYEALMLANTCDNCNCTLSCDIYNNLLSSLTNTTNTTSNDSNCGC